jgi:hypothetical protein
MIQGIVDQISIDDSGYEAIEQAKLDPGVADNARSLLGTLVAQGNRWTSVRGTEFKFVLLSAPSDTSTVLLDRGVINDKTDKNGNPTAFTQGHTYVNLARLKLTERTSQL